MGDYDLTRFREAQNVFYDQALVEMRGGRKLTHWSWFIFPQLRGLGMSQTSWDYGIDGIGEAKAYLADPILRKNLLEISNVLLRIPSDDPEEVMGYPDDLKLRSCMTLFQKAAPEEEVFRKVLEKFFDGEGDPKTLDMLRKEEDL